FPQDHAAVVTADPDCLGDVGASHPPRGDRDLVGGEPPPQFLCEKVLPGETLFLPRPCGAPAPRLVGLGVDPLELVLELADLGRVRLVFLPQLCLVPFLSPPVCFCPLLLADLVAHAFLLSL